MTLISRLQKWGIHDFRGEIHQNTVSFLSLLKSSKNAKSWGHKKTPVLQTSRLSCWLDLVWSQIQLLICWSPWFSWHALNCLMLTLLFYNYIVYLIFMWTLYRFGYPWTSRGWPAAWWVVLSSVTPSVIKAWIDPLCNELAHYYYFI